jgi:predicted nucleic acid-binding protein
MPGSCLDTNILLYAVSADATKAAVANRLIREGGTISVQVLNEAANVTRRKLGWPCTDVKSFLAAVRGLLDVTPLTAETHDRAVRLAESYHLSIYDASIAAAALAAGCNRVWSEDLQDGMVLDGAVRIKNPFL